jgi:hypothetical protein
LANRLQVAPRVKQVKVLRELEMELEYSEDDEDSMFAHDQTPVVSGRQENVDSRGSEIVDAVKMETEDRLRPNKRKNDRRKDLGVNATCDYCSLNCFSIPISIKAQFVSTWPTVCKLHRV